MFKCLLFLSAVLFSAHAINGRCRGLVLGGGTDRAVFQAGAIAGLITYLPDQEATWDVVVGNGVGAFNAFIVSQSVLGEESSLNTTLHDFWSHFNRHKFYKSWFGGKMVGYFKKTGFYNNAPLTKTVNNLFKGTFNRFLAVGITDLYRGLYFIANTTFPSSLMLAAVEASMNDEGNFPVTNYGNNYQFVSGDSIVPVDIQSAINACTYLGYQTSEMTIDVVMVTSDKLSLFDPKGKNTLELLKRNIAIFKYRATYSKVYNDEADYPLVNFRTTITLPTGIKSKDLTPYEYFKAQVVEEYRAGMKAAKEALA